MIVNTGTSQVKYVGIETLKFVENMKQLKMKQIQTSGDSSSYIGWAEQEMSGMSDGYAYVDIDKPLTHGYFDYKGEEKHCIFTADEIDALTKKESKQIIKQELQKREEFDKQLKNEWSNIQQQVINNNYDTQWLDKK